MKGTKPSSRHHLHKLMHLPPQGRASSSEDGRTPAHKTFWRTASATLRGAGEQGQLGGGSRSHQRLELSSSHVILPAQTFPYSVHPDVKNGNLRFYHEVEHCKEQNKSITSGKGEQAGLFFFLCEVNKYYQGGKNCCSLVSRSKTFNMGQFNMTLLLLSCAVLPHCCWGSEARHPQLTPEVAFWTASPGSTGRCRGYVPGMPGSELSCGQQECGKGCWGRVER